MRIILCVYTVQGLPFGCFKSSPFLSSLPLEILKSIAEPREKTDRGLQSFEKSGPRLNRKSHHFSCHCLSLFYQPLSVLSAKEDLGVETIALSELGITQLELDIAKPT